MKKSKASVDRTQTEIVETALKVFSKNGYAATNLQDIAQAMGITRTPIYYHFKNKLQLYEKAVQTFLEKRQNTFSKIYLSNQNIFEKSRLHLLRSCEYGLMEESLFMGVEEIEELAPVNKLRMKAIRFIYETKLQAVKNALRDGQLRPGTDPQGFVRHTYVLYYGILTMVSKAASLHRLSVRERVKLIDTTVEGMRRQYSPETFAEAERRVADFHAGGVLADDLPPNELLADELPVEALGQPTEASVLKMA